MKKTHLPVEWGTQGIYQRERLMLPFVIVLAQSRLNNLCQWCWSVGCSMLWVHSAHIHPQMCAPIQDFGENHSQFWVLQNPLTSETKLLNHLQGPTKKKKEEEEEEEEEEEHVCALRTGNNEWDPKP